MLSAEPAGESRPTIVLADEDVLQAEAFASYLQQHGLDVVAMSRGDQALEEIERRNPDLVLAEISLPGIDGFQLCRRLRDAGFRGALAVLSHRGEDFDRVLALEFGADAYLTKPIEPRVLLAHVKAMLRRGDRVDAIRRGQDELRFGSLVILRFAREVFLGDERIQMTAAEFDLLWLLASHAGEVLPRRRILKALRGLEYQEDRSVDARLYRLRKRFGDTEAVARRIKTVRPHGYMFSIEPW